jgi:hypothetical protein
MWYVSSRLAEDGPETFNVTRSSCPWILSVLYLALHFFPIPLYQLLGWPSSALTGYYDCLSLPFAWVLPCCCRVWLTETLPADHLGYPPDGGDSGLGWSLSLETPGSMPSVCFFVYLLVVFPRQKKPGSDWFILATLLHSNTTTMNGSFEHFFVLF